jgi:hypothetical protein
MKKSLFRLTIFALLTALVLPPSTGRVIAQREAATQNMAVVGQSRDGSKTVHLEAQTRLGKATVDARDFVDGTDRTFIANAQFGAKKMYRSLFSHDNDRTVFLRMRDDDRTTTLVLSDTDDPRIGQLTVWNDGAPPESFRIDVPRFLQTNNHQAAILDGKARRLDLVGRRRPIDITAVEMYKIFGQDPAYKTFMGGELPDIAQALGTPPPGGTRATNWKCVWTCLIPACGIFCLFWTRIKTAPPPSAP